MNVIKKSKIKLEKPDDYPANSSNTTTLHPMSESSSEESDTDSSNSSDAESSEGDVSNLWPNNIIKNVMKDSEIKEHVKTAPIKKEPCVATSTHIKIKSLSGSDDESPSDSEESSSESSDDSDSLENESPNRTISKNVNQQMSVTSQSGNSSCSDPDDEDGMQWEGKDPVLHDIVPKPSEYEIVDAAGPLKVGDVQPGNEYYIFRFPTGMINPSKLVGTKFRIGSKDGNKIKVNEKPYEIAVHENPTGAEMPTVFLPDRAGQLNQVDMNITSHIMIKDLPSSTRKVKEFDINDLRSTKHEPPEIKERNFFGNSDYPSTVSTGSFSSPEKKKLSKEEKKQKRLSKEMNMNATELMLSLIKKSPKSPKKRLSKEMNMNATEQMLSLIEKSPKSPKNKRSIDPIEKSPKSPKNKRSIDPLDISPLLQKSLKSCKKNKRSIDLPDISPLSLSPKKIKKEKKWE